MLTVCSLGQVVWCERCSMRSPIVFQWRQRLSQGLLRTLTTSCANAWESFAVFVPLVMLHTMNLDVIGLALGTVL